MPRVRGPHGRCCRSTTRRPTSWSACRPPSATLAHALRRAALRDGRNLDLEIIGARYERVDRMVGQAVRPPVLPPPRWTDRIDAVLTHRVAGVVVFGVVMLALFQALFSWSEPAIAFIERLVALAQGGVSAALPAGPLHDLLVDGVIAGVGNVIVFVPQIGLLFLFIGVMEDAGYLARVAFVIDRVMGSVGLHGKSFVPMLSGFSCAVPAVMATRTLENRTDRLLTMMVLPLMSCSARLPIYVLVIATVFGPAATHRRPHQRRRRGVVCDVRVVGGRRTYRSRRPAADRAPGPKADVAAGAATLPLAGRRRAGARDVAAGAVVSRRRRDDHPRVDDRHVGAAQLPEARRPTRRRRRAGADQCGRTPGASHGAGARTARARLARRHRDSRGLQRARGLRLDARHRL